MSVLHRPTPYHLGFLKSVTGSNIDCSCYILIIQKNVYVYNNLYIKFLFRSKMKENFYHGILLGLFANMDGWEVWFNAESGDGYSDISIEIEERETGIVIELKYAQKAGAGHLCVLF